MSNHVTPYLELIGRRLRRWRRARGWPMKRIAYELNVSVPAVSDWERGTRFPSIENLMHLALLYQKPVCQMVCAGRKLCPNVQCQKTVPAARKARRAKR